LSRIASILILPLITPYLTGEDYGVYGLILAYVNGFQALKDLGMLSVLSNTFYRHPQKYSFFWNKIFTLLGFWNIILSAIVAIVLALIIPVESSEKLTVILFICIPIALFDNLVYFGSRYLQLIQKPIPTVLISLISSVLTVIISYVYIVNWGMGYVGWFAAAFFSQLITFGIYFGLNLRYRTIRMDYRMSINWLKRHFRVALPTIPHFYSTYLLDVSDRIILGILMVDINLIGLYNLGYTFGQYFNIINVALGISTSALYLKVYHKKSFRDEVKIRNLTFGLGAFMILCAFVIGIWMKEIFMLLIKNVLLQEAYAITVSIIFCYVGKAFYMSSGNKLIALGLTKELWKISFVGGLINVILNFILIPFYGIWGSVMATFLGNSFLFFRTFYLKAYLKNSMNIKYYPMFWFVLTLFVGLVTLALREYGILFKLVVCAALIFGIVTGVYFNRKRLSHAFQIEF